MDQERLRLLETIRSQYERVAWTHKTHEKERELMTSRAKFEKAIEVFFTSSTALTVLVSVFVDGLAQELILGLAVIAAVFAIYRLSSSVDHDAELHRTTAKMVLSERNRLELLIEKCMSSNSSIKEIRDELQQIISRLDTIYMSAPNTTSKAYNIAHRALTEKNELGAVSDEIDEILPEQLRVSTYLKEEESS